MDYDCKIDFDDAYDLQNENECECLCVCVCVCV
jgi:hypothetical protein